MHHRFALEAEIIGIGPPADGQQDIGAEDIWFTLHAIDADTHARISPRKTDAFSGRADSDPFSFKDIANGIGYVGVFTTNQPRRHLDDSHIRAKAPVHLGELEPDIATADHHQMLRHALKLQDRAVGKMGNLI
jgi:hypothetical protein